MGRRMYRGRQQVLLNYLPGKTFDFETIGTIARVERIRGVQRIDLNMKLILRAIEDQVRVWPEIHRPIFRDLDRAVDRFVLIEPTAVEATMFPLVFWCQNPRCGVLTEPHDGVPTSATCSICGVGRLVQLRFIRVHRCGALEPLKSPSCSKCNSKRRMALDTRGSERMADFRWICRGCGATERVFGGRCSCNWPGDDKEKAMSVEVHRAGRTFYPHYAVLLNQPGRELSAFLGVSRWQAVAASMFLEMPETRGRRLVDFAAKASSTLPVAPFTLTDSERARLRAQGTPEQVIAQFERMQAELQVSRREAEAEKSPQGLADALVRRSGVPWDVWERAGQEMLEAIIPLQSGNVTELFSDQGDGAEDRRRARDLAGRLGLNSVTLVTDFPITLATFGYSRADCRPRHCRLNPFPPDPHHKGKFPIFVDVVQADAILLRLDHEAVLRWMAAIGFAAQIPDGEDPSISSRAYFVSILDGHSFRQTIQTPEARLVFGLLHALSHLVVRRASLLCGLEQTSLSEYVLPRTLTCAIYCNHRFGATIGALSALFEQSLIEWLTEIRSSRRCVYDPVCAAAGGNCHACSCLPETSCRFFNLNLSRAFLFGGRDAVLGEIRVGFLDFVFTR
jgi:hypothetical protein